MSKVKIIAEVGINHNGEIDKAIEMIQAAKDCGVDTVKFQTITTEDFVANKSLMLTYQSQGKEVTESQFHLFKRHEFSKAEWQKVITTCKSLDIEFASTAQGPKDLDFLLSMTQLPFIKVGSDDLTNLEIMHDYASRDLPMIVSTGMSYAYEIQDAIEVIRKVNKKKLTILHCVSMYPTMPEQVNLHKITSIKDTFNVEVGFSDHTLGSVAAIGSIYMGATVIEKHFTLGHDLPGPDHHFSIETSELKKFVSDIRTAELCLGNGELVPTKEEMHMRNIARRKIVCAKDLNEGHKLEREDVAFMRHEDLNCLPPKQVNNIIGKTLKNNLKEGDVITMDVLNG
jgi:N,N'-diacetyllegionaminate synthase